MALVWAHCKAELLRLMRNKYFIVFSIGFPVAFYFIFTGMYGDDTQMGGVAWKTYYLMSMTVFGVVGASINTLGIKLAQERKQGWSRLLRTTPLPAGIDLTSKIIAQSAINLGIVLLLFIVASIFKGIELSWAQWVSAGLWIWIGVMPFIAMGTLVGTLKSVELAQIVANISHLALAMLGGLWMPMEIMPKWMQQIGEWLPTYHFGKGAWNIVAGKAVEWSDLAVLSVYFLLFVVLSAYIMKRQEAV